LQWVQRNIAAFGGDPGNVTIFGESAGAGMVNHLMVMSSSAGLFHRAISQSSATGIAPRAVIDRRAGFEPSGEAVGIKFVEKLGVADSEDIASTLRAMTTEELLAGMGERDRFTPVIEGNIIPDQLGFLYAEGKQHKVPYMTGGVSWEASLGRSIGGGFSPEFAAKLVPPVDQARLYPGLSGEALEDRIFGDIIVMTASRHLANSMSAIGAPVYSFYISYVPEARRGKQPGVAHATERDQEVAELISAYWVQFAKTGDPNGGRRPDWPAYDPETARVLEIGDEVIVHEDFLAERMAYHLKRGWDLLERSR
jgi:para-nitrobenzyl esterase